MLKAFRFLRTKILVGFIIAYLRISKYFINFKLQYFTSESRLGVDVVSVFIHTGGIHLLATSSQQLPAKESHKSLSEVHICLKLG